MRKRINAMLMAVVCLFAVSAAACGETYEELTPLTEEEQQEIRAAYTEFYECQESHSTDFPEGINLSFKDYYGTYGDLLVLRYSRVWNAAYRPEYYKTVRIGGVSFGKWHIANKFYVYNKEETDKSKTFMTLFDAYEQDLITKKQLKAIAYYAKESKK